MKIATSFLGIKENIKENILKLDKTNIDYLHVDIMDGNFVPNKTWDIEEINELLKNTTKKKDVHLMVEDIKKYVDEYVTIKPDIITFHVEAQGDKNKIIDYIKDNNIKAGISLKPNTSIEEIKPYLDKIDLVLVMTVEPGKGGQKFISEMIEKVNELRKLKQEKNYNYLIEADGGINNETIKLIDVDIAVVGSYITNGNYQEQINKLKG